MFKKKDKQNTIINIKPKSTKILPFTHYKNGKECQRFMVFDSCKFSGNKNLQHKDKWAS